MPRQPFYLLVIIIILAISASLFSLISQKLSKPSPIPPPTTVNVEGRQKVKYPQDYTIVMLGDSMTETLGNSDEIKKFLIEYYPGKTFEVLNYGFGSTNILSALERITSETEHTRIFRPIAEIDYDLILIESFGHNPLSELKIEEGLKRQNEELDKIVAKLKETNPSGKIVFVATISPNKQIFAKSAVDLSLQTRSLWVEERIAYINNHIRYANDHNIPIINIFKASLLANGDGNPDYINTDDYIHPSPTGIVFISHQIADFIYQNQIFPH